MRIANFIIGGTEKAGTTSVFTYLGEHPQVCGSANKETDYFRQEFSGDSQQDRRQYARYFTRCGKSERVVMEASPGYLGEAVSVVPRIRSLVPDMKFLFILRNPVERLYSSYNFHVGKLEIPEAVSIDEYVEKCLAFDRGDASEDVLGMGEWHLKVLRFGCYADFLRLYFDVFPKDQIKVMFFEQLRDDVSGFINELSVFLNIDTGFWDSHEFRKANVTFSGSNRLLHRIAMYANSRIEPFLRQRPELKRSLVSCYKKINQAREGYDPMPLPVRQKLEAYYRPSIRALGDLLGESSPASWQVQALPQD